MKEPRIYTTTEWGAQRVRSAGFALSRAGGIVIHNTESPNRAPAGTEAEQPAAFALARQIQCEHRKGRGWADTGQHFTISRGGLLLEGRTGTLAAAHRGMVVQGAHAGVPLYNRTWFGIELEGDNREEFLVTAPQWEALVELCAWLSLWGGFDSQNIRAHCEVKGDVSGGTDCPGRVVSHLPEMRARVHTRKAEIRSARSPAA